MVAHEKSSIHAQKLQEAGKNNRCLLFLRRFQTGKKILNRATLIYYIWSTFSTIFLHVSSPIAGDNQEINGKSMAKHIFLSQ